MENIKEKFDKISRDYKDRMLRLEPVAATYLGCHEFDHLLGDPGPDAGFRILDLQKETAAALDLLPENKLDPSRLIDKRLLANQIDILSFELEACQSHLKGGRPVEFFSSALHPLFSRDFAPVEQRATAIAGRLNGAEKYFESCKRCFKEPVRLWVEDEIDCSLAGVRLISTITEVISGMVGTALAEDLRKAGRRASAALDRFTSWLKNEVLPVSSDNAWCLGRGKFTRLLKLRRIPMDPDELLDFGRGIFSETSRAADIERQRCENGPARDDLSSFENLLSDYRSAIDLSKALVQETGFASIPDNESLSVEATPDFLKSTLPTAAYFPPEALAPPPYKGVYVVTEPASTEDFAAHGKASIANTSFHEAYPGHHLQSVQAAIHSSPIRLFVNAMEFVEGWAHYCEEELCRLVDPPPHGLKLAQLEDAMFRALRVEIDVGLQCGLLSIDEAVELMVEKLGQSPACARAEVTWYSYSPAVPLSYLVGKHMVRNLRRDVEYSAPGSFEQRSFHDKLISQGNLPIWALRAILLP